MDGDDPVIGGAWSDTPGAPLADAPKCTVCGSALSMFAIHYCGGAKSLSNLPADYPNAGRAVAQAGTAPASVELSERERDRIAAWVATHPEAAAYNGMARLWEAYVALRRRGAGGRHSGSASPRAPTAASECAEGSYHEVARREPSRAAASMNYAPLVDSGVIDLLYQLSEAAGDQPHPTPALRKAVAEYERRKEVIHRASHPAKREADVAETCAAQVIGRRGGKRGGPARAKALSPARRAEIAKKAAEVRWNRERGLRAAPPPSEAPQ